jgi:hypothetical protein
MTNPSALVQLVGIRIKDNLRKEDFRLRASAKERGFIAIADNGGEGVEHVAVLIENAADLKSQVDESSTTPDPTSQAPDAQPKGSGTAHQAMTPRHMLSASAILRQRTSGSSSQQFAFASLDSDHAGEMPNRRRVDRTLRPSIRSCHSGSATR